MCNALPPELMPVYKHDAYLHPSYATRTLSPAMLGISLVMWTLYKSTSAEYAFQQVRRKCVFTGAADDSVDPVAPSYIQPTAIVPWRIS